MNERLREIVGDPPERKVVSKKAERSTIDNVCENCDQPYDAGTWVIKVSVGNYEHFIHEVCPPTAATAS